MCPYPVLFDMEFLENGSLNHQAELTVSKFFKFLPLFKKVVKAAPSKAGSTTEVK